jgi:hypothetical protein
MAAGMVRVTILTQPGVRATTLPNADGADKPPITGGGLNTSSRISLPTA